jgi:hypothetical protein
VYGSLTCLHRLLDFPEETVDLSRVDEMLFVPCRELMRHAALCKKMESCFLDIDADKYLKPTGDCLELLCMFLRQVAPRLVHLRIPTVFDGTELSSIVYHCFHTKIEVLEILTSDSLALLTLPLVNLRVLVYSCWKHEDLEEFFCGLTSSDRPRLETLSVSDAAPLKRWNPSFQIVPSPDAKFWAVWIKQLGSKCPNLKTIAVKAQ